MSSLDAGALADVAVRLALLSMDQVEEAWEELGARRAVPASDFLRCMERRGYLTPFQSNKLLRGDEDGYFLGGYRILYKIASGSFGRVYRAVDPSSGRVVAIKVLRRKWTDDKHKVDLFMREGKVGMTLRHPNIVEILSVNYEKRTNQYYIVMDFVEGGNMRDLLNIRKKLEPAEVMRVLEDTTLALAYALSKGITHRDMKLTNILMSSQGPVKLVDFGLAGGAQYSLEDKDEITVDRTVDYAGLEKTTDAPHGDPRSDLYFLGCIVHELLTGRSPLAMTRSAVSRMAAERFLKIVPMKPDEVNAPPSVFRLVESLMALDPERRIQTPSQLLDHVRECRAELERNNSTQNQSNKLQPTIFVVESGEGLQDIFRTKLKEKGYRVLIAADPIRALERFRQKPFDLLIVNTASTGENGYYVFAQIMEDAQRRDIPCSGILMQESDQSDWGEKLAELPNVSILIHPLKYKQVLRAIESLLVPNSNPASS